MAKKPNGLVIFLLSVSLYGAIRIAGDACGVPAETSTLAAIVAQLGFGACLIWDLVK